MAEMITKYGFEVPVGTHEGKTVVLCSDHRGFGYKRSIFDHLFRKGFLVVDVGTDSAERCDYPIFSDRMGELVSERYPLAVGIGVCGSGIGITIPASKHLYVYDARCLTPAEALTSRQHNNTNVLGIGADCTGLEAALDVVDAWLGAPFDPVAGGGSYLERYVQMMKIDEALRKRSL